MIGLSVIARWQDENGDWQYVRVPDRTEDTLGWYRAMGADLSVDAEDDELFKYVAHLVRTCDVMKRHGRRFRGWYTYRAWRFC